MNFESIRSRIGKYETEANSSAIAKQLKLIISNNGLEIFKSIDLLNNEINKSSLSATAKAQLSLIFSCSTLPAFILNSKSDMNMVDVDNAVHSVVNSTGLSYKCAITLIADIFYACGLSFAIEYGPQLTETGIEYTLHALMPSAMAEAEITAAQLLFNLYKNNCKKMAGKKMSDEDKKLTQNIAENASLSIKKLCASGIPEGFYMLGLCYLNGECGTDISKENALKCMKLAAERGVSKAAAAVGDILYNSEDIFERNYTLAHHYYTRPGAIALDQKRQGFLEDIYKQRKANKTTFVFSGMLLALTLIFVIFFSRGLFGGESIIVLGIILTIVSAISLVLTVIYNHSKSFNGIRSIISVQYFIWALYALIMVLS